MVLKGIEQKIEALFEGVFGRAFRTNVQPVELARKLAKEMDDHKTVSVSRIYVPNEYTIFLSTSDREQFEAYESSLLSELEEYLVEHAKRESYALLTAPLVKLETDDDLGVGEFGISTRVVQPRGARHGPEQPEERLTPGATVVYKPGGVAPEEPVVGEATDEATQVAVLSWRGQRKRIEQERAVIGRSRECDVVVDDANVSRRHAELRQEGPAFWVVDLDSTNGIEVNGRRLRRAKLEDGDTFVVGETEITFSTEPD
ncbi:MAG: FhaA domain-containing protein [Gaiellaceae bacterium]